MSQRSLYTLGALTMRSTYMIPLAVLVAAFVALYPYLTGMSSCGPGECPYAVQPSQGAAGIVACVVAVLAVSSAVGFASAIFRGYRLPATDRCPTQLYLSPDSPPPQFS